MPKIRSASQTAEKWARVTPQRAPDYEIGVQNPKKDWAEETAKAEKNYEAGIQKSIQEKSFGKGVKKAGTSKWQKGAVGKGVARYGQGVVAAVDDYEKGFAPYRDVIENTKLPPRYPKGDPRNFERVKAMGTALHEAKKRIKGS